jgi:type IV pilus assembly protein PilC
MPEFVLKYADARGQIHNQVAEAATERELRDRMTQQGFLVYTVRQRADLAAKLGGGGRKKIDMEKFLIFNQQFLTLVRAGLPILKSLDLLGDRLTDPKLGKHVKAVRDEVKTGTLLSDAFAKQGVFPPIYITSILAGEKSGALAEVIERFIGYQKMALGVRKKLVLALMYPAVLVCLVGVLIVFMITYVVPNFAELYKSLNASLPFMTQMLILVGTAARDYIVVGALALAGIVVAARLWAGTEAGAETIERVRVKIPVLGDIWLKYQSAQLARVLATLLVGGIPLLQAMETAAESMGSRLMKQALNTARQLVKEGRPLSSSLAAAGIMPPLAIDMIEVGESTGALPQMLASVAEFFEEDVTTRMSAALTLVEPAIMLFMGVFVAFVLVSLYLPIFSLADAIGG